MDNSRSDIEWNRFESLDLKYKFYGLDMVSMGHMKLNKHAVAVSELLKNRLQKINAENSRPVALVA